MDRSGEILSEVGREMREISGNMDSIIMRLKGLEERGRKMLEVLTRDEK